MSVYMDPFSSILEYFKVDLYTAPDIVQFSCIVQNSISHLNLELCRSYPVQRPSRWFRFEGSPSLSYSGDIINTEEKCRKVLAKRRKLLYKLHLDLPRGREYSLKTDTKQLEWSYEFPYQQLHLIKISIDKRLYNRILLYLVEYACKYSNRKYSVLNWFIKVNEFEDNSLDMPSRLVNNFLDCMQPGLCDLKFATDCFKTLKLSAWLQVNVDTEKMENLLFHLNQADEQNLDVGNFSYFKILCVLHFNHIGAVLKIQSSPFFGDYLFICAWIQHEIIWNFHARKYREILETTNWENPKRQALLLYLLWLYICRFKYPSEVTEALRLVWESIPDSFFSYEEVTTVFASLGPKEAVNIYEFYSQSVSEFDSKVLTRSLQHFCRISIRRRLAENRNWLPESIEETGLPQKLKSYLNLKKKKVEPNFLTYAIWNYNKKA